MGIFPLVSGGAPSAQGWPNDVVQVEHDAAGGGQPGSGMGAPALTPAKLETHPEVVREGLRIFEGDLEDNPVGEREHEDVVGGKRNVIDYEEGPAPPVECAKGQKGSKENA